MGVPASEICYTPAMPRREDHEVHKDMWGHWGGGGGSCAVYALGPKCSAQDIGFSKKNMQLAQP